MSRRPDRRAADRGARCAEALAAAVAAFGLAGCAGVAEKVILLPQPDGAPSAVIVSTGKQQLALDKPYAVAERRGESLQPARTTAAEVQQRYGAVLAAQPARPRVFVVQFDANGSQLTVQARPVLAEFQAALARLPAPEVIVVGHTDRVGSADVNDRLSLQRAETVRELLVAAGVPRAAITVAGRGERDPLVPTADEVAEPRNRRVEIKLR